jgi:hypothetical protein
LLTVFIWRNFELSEYQKYNKTEEFIQFHSKTIIMAELTAQIFRDSFGGSWSGVITRNGELKRRVVFNWPELSGNFSSLGTGQGLMVPPGGGVLDDTRQVAISGWRPDIRRWVHLWHNEYGGYGEIQWTSQEVVNNVTILYGFCHECKQETDDITDHIIMCELFDQDNFKYTIRSFRKGILEIAATRIRTAKELNELLEKQAKTTISFAELIEL